MRSNIERMCCRVEYDSRPMIFVAVLVLILLLFGITLGIQSTTILIQVAPYSLFPALGMCCGVLMWRKRTAFRSEGNSSLNPQVRLPVESSPSTGRMDDPTLPMRLSVISVPVHDATNLSAESSDYGVPLTPPPEYEVAAHFPLLETPPPSYSDDMKVIRDTKNS